MRGKAWIAPLLTGLAIAIAVHFAAVLAAPGLIMTKAMDVLSIGQSRVNMWTHGKRSSPTEQYVVRPSPDLAYSSCVWDLTEGPVHITAPRWDGYYSLSVFNDNTDNFFVANDRSTGGGGTDIFLVTNDQKGGMTAPSGSRLVVSPSKRGVALLRYLAPTDALFAAADEARRGAKCETLRN